MQDKITVLYVDDSNMLLSSVKRQLEITGEYRVLTTDSLVAASSMIADADVALLDWDPMGPAMIAACCAAKVPFVIYTGDPGHPSIPRDQVILGKPATSTELCLYLKVAMMNAGVGDDGGQP